MKYVVLFIGLFLSSQPAVSATPEWLKLNWSLDITYSDSEKKTFELDARGDKITLSSMSSWSCLYKVWSSEEKPLEEKIYFEAITIFCTNTKTVNGPVVLLPVNCGRKGNLGVENKSSILLFNTQKDIREYRRFHKITLSCNGTK